MTDSLSWWFKVIFDFIQITFFLGFNLFNFKLIWRIFSFLFLLYFIPMKWLISRCQLCWHFSHLLWFFHFLRQFNHWRHRWELFVYFNFRNFIFSVVVITILWIYLWDAAIPFILERWWSVWFAGSRLSYFKLFLVLWCWFWGLWLNLTFQ